MRVETDDIAREREVGCRAYGPNAIILVDFLEIRGVQARLDTQADVGIVVSIGGLRGRPIRTHPSHR
jgi:hypothetical protein